MCRDIDSERAGLMDSIPGMIIVSRHAVGFTHSPINEYQFLFPGVRQPELEYVQTFPSSAAVSNA